MKIIVIKEKYSCGCGRGLIKFDFPDALEKINKVIDWDGSTFPLEDYTEEELQKIRAATLELLENNGGEIKSDENIVAPRKEHRDFLGLPPKLKPGDCFSWDDSIFTIEDESNVILLKTQTGPKIVDRFELAVELEYELLTRKHENTKIEKSGKQIPEDAKTMRINYSTWQIMKERCPEFTEATLKIENPDILVFPTTVWIKKQDIFYEDFVDKEIIQTLLSDMYNWIWENK